MTDTTTQAVIEAARKLRKYIRTDIRTNNIGESDLDVSIFVGGGRYGVTYEESDRPFPDTLFGCMASLAAALDAHDETSHTD